MTTLTKNVLGCSLLLLLISVPAIASDRFDGEVGAVWWANDFESGFGTAIESVDSAAPGLRAELWVNKKYGVRATQFGSDLDDLDADGADYTSVDVMWRAFSPTDNNFVAIGMGWQQMDFDGVDVDGDTSGLRLSVEGRVGIMDQVYGYGQGTLMPSLGDMHSLTADYRSLDGYEYEIGVAWNVAPFVSMRAGYRADSIDFIEDRTVIFGGGASIPTPAASGVNTMISLAEAANSRQSGLAMDTNDGTTESKGLFFGLGFRF